MALQTPVSGQVRALLDVGYVLEQPDGRQLVVEQYVEPVSAYKAQRPAFEAVLASATTG